MGPWQQFEHGQGGYMYHGCRCAVCRAANTARHTAHRQARYARAAAGDPGVPHGSGGYTNWGCRCDVCTQANTVASRIGRAQRAAKRRREAR